MRVLLARIVGLLRGFLAGKRCDRDLDDEVRFHVDMLVDDYVRRGLSRDEARAMALRSFGGITQVKESYRDQRSLPWIEMFAQDARYGIRTLLRAPGFTIAALLTLALGIGANSAIFSVVNAVLLRPLPYFEPERLVHLVWRHPRNIGSNQTGLRYMFFREQLKSVEALAAYTGLGSFNLVLTDRAEFVSALGVSKEYFTVFGVRPAIGQPFTEEHDRAGGPDVAILMDALWHRQFGADPGVIGRSLLLGDKSYTIVGVMPASFRATATVDLLLPLQTGTTGRGGGFNYMVAGRLRPGVSVERASADVATAWHAFKEQHPKALISNELPSSFVGLQESMAGSVRPALMMMLVAVGLLLLIACANTANLLVARALGRGREMAVRAALGAGRSRLARQLLTESVLLALAGGTVGILLAYWFVPALLSLTPPGFVLSEDVRIDSTVLLVTLSTAVLTGLVFGIAPALSVTRRDLVEAFKADSGRTSSGRRSGGLRGALVVAEITVCMLLLIGAGLLTQTFLRLRAIDPGFDPRGVLAARMSMQGDRYSNPQDINRFYDEGLQRIRRIPGVRSAAVASGLPLARALNLNVDVLDWPENSNDRVQDELTDWRYVTPTYFDTMRIPIVAGRGFTDRDTSGAPPVAIVSEQFARRLFKGTNAIGRHIRVFDADGAMEIVGMAKDLKEGGLKGVSRFVMYVPVAQTHAQALKIAHGYFQTNWVVRADRAGPELNRQIAEQIRQVDPRQPFSAFRTMDEVKNAAMATERFQMTLLGAFAVTGLLLAGAGIYGLIAYSVAQRTREFGIRLALGATRRRIVRSVIRQGAAMAIGGITLGAAGAAALSKVLQNYVWGVSPLDARTYAAVGLLLLVVAAAASLVPALRAVRMNPLRALRE